jgi:hypothetical protein
MKTSKHVSNESYGASRDLCLCHAMICYMVNRFREICYSSIPAQYKVKGKGKVVPVLNQEPRHLNTGGTEI